MSNKPLTKKKKREFPHAFVILFAILVLMTVLTWVLPAGQYDSVTVNGVTTVDPDSFHYVESTPVNLFEMFKAIPLGIQNGISLICMILTIGAAIGLIDGTGAIRAALVSMTRRTGDKSGKFVLAGIMVFFLCIGAFPSMFEACIPFLPIVVPVCLLLGYDVVTAVCLVVIGDIIGWTAGPTNLYTVGNSHNIGGMQMFSGIDYRLIVLVVLVSTNTFTMQFSASVAIFAAIAVGALNRNNRITLKKIVDALEAGGRGTITVAVACAMAGLVAGCITSTGLASKLITAIVAVSQGKPLIALFLTMLCCIVLGMGVPTTANYCIMAATCAPILIAPEIGINLVCAHFFVFYFGIVADITPPVALAAYAGSAIAKAPPMKTALNATRLAVAAFIVPYILAFNPAMVFIDTNALQVVQICITSLLGIFGIAAALNGFLFGWLSVVERLVLIVGGLCMMDPGAWTDLLGLVLVGGVTFWQKNHGLEKDAETGVG